MTTSPFKLNQLQCFEGDLGKLGPGPCMHASASVHVEFDVGGNDCDCDDDPRKKATSQT
ncbi:hypothetical protein SERLA73DRAFT_191919 [Serpula lacrymans var. lacrymans S7.3]|uniref:Uncharacterized protein n=2 Tax=Serpula lacrymans var. lacrymans TaxID=341189 RepID=F8QIL7_SERL3|nr:uncharacterized protein SERLADRAFT_465888 [Serpula lacrymans var. lacrymans S7.9]EGN91856.1 hypothetical protein SERLA73DRAFT_191919 [Serpula lacrymans var. lacrymans S7.3]EGO25557.1 hypothetical protein SERLADRAFT_465888 [Serpula lacrymans var. lacrymans S7.9]